MTTFNNIYSGSSDGLLAALTNPTELAYRKGKLKHHYPITDKNGKTWRDAEAAYQAFKTGNTPRDKQIMTRIIKRKFEQHPKLVEAVRKRGGAEYLKECSHIVGSRRSRWEGVKMQSNFICCLVNAYKAIAE